MYHEAFATMSINKKEWIARLEGEVEVIKKMLFVMVGNQPKVTGRNSENRAGWTEEDDSTGKRSKKKAAWSKRRSGRNPPLMGEES